MVSVKLSDFRSWESRTGGLGGQSTWRVRCLKLRLRVTANHNRFDELPYSSELPEGLIKCRFLGPSPSVLDSVVWGGSESSPL